MDCQFTFGLFCTYKLPILNIMSRVFFMQIEHVYTGPLDTEVVDAMNDCDPDVSYL